MYTTVQVSHSELYFPPPGIVIRAGVIPYTITLEQRYYLLGLFPDKIYTDMGGGCKTSRHERPIDCLVREIEEETDPETAKVVITTLTHQLSQIEVWRQTGDNFKDLGYPFSQRCPGPIHRYYVFLEIYDPMLHLGGPTLKKEVNCYQWISEKDLQQITPLKVSSSCRDFLLDRKLITT